VVGTTGIEPVTPTMSTQRVDGIYSEIPVCYASKVPIRSRLDHGYLGRFLGGVDPPDPPDANRAALAGSPKSQREREPHQGTQAAHELQEVFGRRLVVVREPIGRRFRTRAKGGGE
jgi:hypothetical protein